MVGSPGTFSCLSWTDILPCCAGFCMPRFVSQAGLAILAMPGSWFPQPPAQPFPTNNNLQTVVPILPQHLPAPCCCLPSGDRRRLPHGCLPGWAGGGGRDPPFPTAPCPFYFIVAMPSPTPPDPSLPQFSRRGCRPPAPLLTCRQVAFQFENSEPQTIPSFLFRGL